MKKINKFKYRPFHQFPFCCVPTTLQWIFYRRGLDILDPMTIGGELGLRIPEKFEKYIDKEFLDSNKVKIMPKDTDSKNFGTQILKKEFSISNFFHKFNIPLKISDIYQFDNINDIVTFLDNNFSDKKDIIIRLHTHIFKPNYEKYGGHFSVIADYDNSNHEIVVGDPDPPHFKKATPSQILSAISDNQDGIKRGFYVVESIK